MKFVQTDDGYKLTDLYLTAALLSGSGDKITFDRIEKAGNRQFFFVVKGTPSYIGRCIDAFFAGRYVCPNAKAMGQQVRDLKSLVFNREICNS